MKMIKELSLKSEKELREMLNDSRRKLRDLRFKAASNQLKNVREIRKIRRLIALLLFVIKSKHYSQKRINKENPEKKGK